MRWFRVAVVIIWVGLIAVLFYEPGNDVPAPAISPPPSTSIPLPVEDTWMGVYMHDQKIGYTHHRQFPEDGGYRFEEQSVLHLTVLDTEQTVRTEIHAVTTRDHALRSFAISLHSGAGDLVARGTIEGKLVKLRLETAGQVSEEEIVLDEAIYLPTTVRAWVAGEGLRKGLERTFQVFDPSAMRNHPMTMRVEGQELIGSGDAKVQAWRVAESFRGLGTVVWYDDAGQVLREEGPMGLVVVAESPTNAVSAGWSEGEGFDLMTAVAVQVSEPIADARNLDRLEVRLGGLGEITVPNDERQTYRDGVLEIRREGASQGGTFDLPYVDDRWRDELRATPFLQTEHTSVRETAKEVLAGERDARRAASRLRRWVFTTIEKTPVASIPNALQVLEMKAGDCNEHAVLLAALARASGLPARVVAGAVYVEETFLYHAWNEVWLGTGWVSVDAAFDQMPVDATHVKFVEGGPEEHAALLPLMGQLSIKVLSSHASDAGAG